MCWLVPLSVSTRTGPGKAFDFSRWCQARTFPGSQKAPLNSYALACQITTTSNYLSGVVFSSNRGLVFRIYHSNSVYTVAVLCPSFEVAPSPNIDQFIYMSGMSPSKRSPVLRVSIILLVLVICSGGLVHLATAFTGHSGSSGHSMCPPKFSALFLLFIYYYYIQYSLGHQIYPLRPKL